MKEITELSNASEFAQAGATQMRKGVLAYSVLLLCSHGKVYSSDIIARLHDAELIVVEGTLYPLLSRLTKEGLLAYEWQESEQGPPRKYYWLTEGGRDALGLMASAYKSLQNSIKKLEKGTV
jgi:PadR family transcriptional regulator PadR